MCLHHIHVLDGYAWPYGLHYHEHWEEPYMIIPWQLLQQESLLVMMELQISHLLADADRLELLQLIGIVVQQEIAAQGGPMS